ncbi:Conserved_hypothetical protein [Hexamita inflata]|uniref:Uncharacterized protein n=1 Tax=Hexamita inflata TaxID=28002 RepID=A0AA86P380_9EUKA|nr:Conserved hypothetical protein [Hexamita inflata]
MNIQNMIRLHPSIDVYLQFHEGEFKLYSKYQGKVLYSFKPTKVQITNVQNYQLYQGKLYVQACDLYVLQDFDLELVVQLPSNSQFFTFCKQMYVISYKTVYQILDNQLVHLMNFEHNTEVFQFGTFVFFKQNEIFYSCQMKNNKFTMNYGHSTKVEGDLVFHGSGLCLFKKDKIYNCFNLMTGQCEQKKFKEIIYTAGCCGTQIRNDIANKLFGFHYALDVKNIFNSHFEANGTPDYMRQLLKMCNKCEFRIKDQEMIEWETDNLRENIISFKKLKYCFKFKNQNRSLVFVEENLYVIDGNRNILKRIYLNINSQYYKPVICNGNVYIQCRTQLFVLEYDKLVYICEMPSSEHGLFVHFNNLYYNQNNIIYVFNNFKFKLYVIQKEYMDIIQFNNRICINQYYIRSIKEIFNVAENIFDTKSIHNTEMDWIYYSLYQNVLIYENESNSKNTYIIDMLTNTTYACKTKEFTEQNVKYLLEFNGFGAKLKQQLYIKYNIKQQVNMQEVTNCYDICNNSVTQLDVQINTENILYSNPQSTLQFYQYINILPVIQPNLYAVVEDGFLHYVDFNNTVLHRIPIDFSQYIMNSANKQFEKLNNNYISQKQILISNGNIYIFNYEKLYRLQYQDNQFNVQFVTDIPLKEHYKYLQYYYFSYEDSLYVILQNDIYVLSDNQFVLFQTLEVALGYNYQAIQFCNNVYLVFKANIYKLETGANNQFKFKELGCQEYYLDIAIVCGGVAIFDTQYSKYRYFLNMITSEIKQVIHLDYLEKNNQYEIKSMGLQLKQYVLTQLINDSFESQANQCYKKYLKNIKRKHFKFSLLLNEIYSKQYKFDKTNRKYHRIEEKTHAQQQTIMIALNSVLERQAYYCQIFDQICFSNEAQ